MNCCVCTVHKPHTLPTCHTQRQGQLCEMCLTFSYFRLLSVTVGYFRLHHRSSSVTFGYTTALPLHNHTKSNHYFENNHQPNPHTRKYARKNPSGCPIERKSRKSRFSVTRENLAGIVVSLFRVSCVPPKPKQRKPDPFSSQTTRTTLIQKPSLFSAHPPKSPLSIVTPRDPRLTPYPDLC